MIYSKRKLYPFAFHIEHLVMHKYYLFPEIGICEKIYIYSVCVSQLDTHISLYFYHLLSKQSMDYFQI